MEKDYCNICSEGTAQPLWLDASHITTTLDVRDDQRKGKEPFHKIMSAVRKLAPGDILLLQNTFDPVPLYDALGKLGFEGWGRQVGAEDWEIYFIRQDAGPSQAAEPDAEAPSREGRVIEMDNRGLEPPQPLVRIMNALADMGPDDILVATMPHRPMHLYPILDERGFSVHSEDLPGGEAKVVIRKSGGE